MNEFTQIIHAWLTDYQRLEIIGTAVGLLYIYQEIKASIWLWATGIVMPAIYIFVYYEAGLYADFAMQVYYILAGVYGFVAWKWNAAHGKDASELPISHMPHRLYMPAAATFAVLWVALYLILIRFTNSTVPLYDAFGNALSIVALWALARKYMEQWLLWIVVDVELAALYAYKGIPFTAGLYLIYALLAVWGYFKWKQKYTKAKHDEH